MQRPRQDRWEPGLWAGAPTLPNYAHRRIDSDYTDSRIFTIYSLSRIFSEKGFPMEQIGRTAKQLGAIIRRQRRQVRLSQEQLGSTVRLRQATISKLEAGEPATQMQTLLDVLAALDLEIVVRPRTTASTADIENLF
jgi:HTH-type transcriptional regulator/antitoxin HipB